MAESDWRLETKAVHAGERRPGPEGSLVFPIYQGTVFEVEPGTGYDDLKYIRLNSTPSQRYLHDKLAGLEGAEAALATASGMAAFGDGAGDVSRAWRSPPGRRLPVRRLSRLPCPLRPAAGILLFRGGPGSTRGLGGGPEAHDPAVRR